MDLPANQGPFHGHKTAANTVESFIGYTYSDLRQTVTYGTESAPYLATACLKKLAEKEKGEISPGNYGTFTAFLHG